MVDPLVYTNNGVFLNKNNKLFIQLIIKISMYKERYEKKKSELLKSKKFTSGNKKIIAEFLEFQEYKLKRKEGLSEVDERSYKTLYFYIGRIKNLNKWFKRKDWTKLTEEDIKKVIDDLEDGIIKTGKGTRYTDRSLYYQMLTGRFFEIAGKDYIASKILKKFGIRGRHDKNEVRFLDEESFKRIVDCAITPIQKCLLWLAWDIGENIGSLLELEKDDFQRGVNSETGEPEYLVRLNKDKLKRSRTARSEFTNYNETVKWLDIVLNDLQKARGKFSNKYVQGRDLNELYSKDQLFKLGISSASDFLKRAVKKAGVKCAEGQEITWKDLRSSMACHLLKEGWTTDEVNARLGHKPSSRMIDKYVNYLALDKRKPQKKVYDSNLKRFEIELEKQKETNKLQGLRFDNFKRDHEQLKSELDKWRKLFEDMTLVDSKNRVLKVKS
jgi:hypothetical protein